MVERQLQAITADCELAQRFCHDFLELVADYVCGENFRFSPKTHASLSRLFDNEDGTLNEISFAASKQFDDEPGGDGLIIYEIYEAQGLLVGPDENGNTPTVKVEEQGEDGDFTSEYEREYNIFWETNKFSIDDRYYQPRKDIIQEYVNEDDEEVHSFQLLGACATSVMLSEIVDEDIMLQWAEAGIHSSFSEWDQLAIVGILKRLGIAT